MSEGDIKRTTITIYSEDLADFAIVKKCFSQKSLGIKIQIGRIAVAAMRHVIENKKTISVEGHKVKFT